MLRTRTKNIIVAILAAVVLLGAVTGIFAITNRDKASEGYELVNASFSIGALDTTGSYKESEKSLYTKEAFECQDGVKIEVDFDSNIKWQVFYYDELYKFISSTDSFDSTDFTSAPDEATYARIMITPIWDKDVDKDDQVITLFNKKNFVKQIVISVKELVEEEETAD